MVHIQTQDFFDRNTGNRHEVSILFGHINPVSNGQYDVMVDGKKYASTKTKGRAFDEVVNVIKETGWSPVNPL